jgi:aarF domain-containing kinase
MSQYHYVSFSWIIGGIVERVSGLHIHDLVCQRVSAPLGQDGNMLVGLLPPALQHRAARLETPQVFSPLPLGWNGEGEGDGEGSERGGGEGLKQRVFSWLEGWVFVAAGNAALWRKVCLPSSNGFFTADALARMYGALTNAGALAPSEGQRTLVRSCTLDQVVASWRDT